MTCAVIVLCVVPCVCVCVVFVLCCAVFLCCVVFVFGCGRGGQKKEGQNFHTVFPLKTIADFAFGCNTSAHNLQFSTLSAET